MVCKLQLAVLLAIVAVCLGLTFPNPVLEGIGSHKAIKYNNLYYLVGSEDVGNLANWLPIYVSADGETWARLSYAFNNETIPKWTSGLYLDEPFLFYEGGIFYLFFVSHEYQSNRFKIGVATSKSITGPFIGEPQPLPLPVPSNQFFHSPAIIRDNNNGDTYLIWSEDDYNIRGQMIYLADFTLSGLGSEIIFTTSPTWEEAAVKSPNVIYRNGYYYLFYAGGQGCSSSNAIGVARSRFPVGKYERKSGPLIREWASVPSVLQGTDGSSDIILYQGRCSVPSYVNASTLIWDSNDWPTVVSS